MIDDAIILGILEALKKVKKIITPKGKIQEIIKNSEVRKQLIKNCPSIFFIICNKGIISLGDNKNIGEKEKDSIYSRFKENKSNNVIKIFHDHFYERIKIFKNIQISDKKIDKYVNTIDSTELKNLFVMSKYVKKLYGIGNDLEAKKVKKEIGIQYGKNGRKFCNLFLQDYFYHVIKYVEENEEKNFEDTAVLFLINSDTIFFIHEFIDKKKEILKLKNFIDKKEKYIALHAASKKNIDIANEIYSKIEEVALEKSYKTDKEKKLSKSNVPLLNIYLYHK